MKLTLRDAIFTAISYADIFDYPLTEEEVKMWLPYLRRYSERSLKKIFSSCQIDRRLFEKRKKRALWSADKWVLARRIAKLLTIIPTITLVGVTGGLTRSNAEDTDDIDFIIITTPKTLWVTRALSTILLDFFGLRRRPVDTNVTNLVCLNMFMSEDGLAIHKKERDLFSAHEVLLMTPLWERDGAYKKFLSANRWGKMFLPRAWERKKEKGKRKTDRKVTMSSILRLPFAVYLLPYLEALAKFIQLWYMRKRRSTEIVTDTVIRFHPRDARGWIKEKLGVRLKRFNIPLDKIFYGR